MKLQRYEFGLTQYATNMDFDKLNALFIEFAKRVNASQSDFKISESGLKQSAFTFDEEANEIAVAYDLDDVYNVAPHLTETEGRCVLHKTLAMLLASKASNRCNAPDGSESSNPVHQAALQLYANMPPKLVPCHVKIHLGSGTTFEMSSLVDLETGHIPNARPDEFSKALENDEIRRLDITTDIASSKGSGEKIALRGEWGELAAGRFELRANPQTYPEYWRDLVRWYGDFPEDSSSPKMRL